MPKTVLPGANNTAHLSVAEPMDNNSVKNCATVAHMRQKPSNPAFRGGSQLAYQASRWTRAEEIKAFIRDYKRTNERYKEHDTEYNRQYRQLHPEKSTQNFNNRRARIQQASGSFTSRDWKKLCKQYDHTCLCCGRREPEIKLTVDHVIPLSAGGTSSIDNIQPLCQSCNSSKHTKTIDYHIN